MERDQEVEPTGSETTLASLKKGVSDLEPVTPSTLGREEQGRAAILEAQASGLTSLHSLREKWSPFLMILLGLTTFFQAFLIVAVGTGWLPFKDNQIFANTVASELFLQIAGMGYVVIRCLFPSDEVKKSQDQTNRSSKSKK